jgi:2-polyprenylphenol 6-hydroxylase
VNTHYDIVISGGGMAGLAQALALSGLGLRIALFDQQPAPPPASFFRERMGTATFSDRVSALTPATRQLLDSLGVWQALTALRVCPYTDMEVWEADGTGRIHFAAAELHLDCLGYIVENALLTCVLAEAAAQKPDLALQFGCAVETIDYQGATWNLTLDTDTIATCSLLIGADGAMSRVRDQAGFAVREWSYGQQALVCTVHTAKPHRHTAWQRFMQTGPLAYLPLQLPGAVEQHHCSIVWSCDEPLAAELLTLPPEAFAQGLEQGLESRLGAVQVLSTPKAFPLQQRHAKDYVKQGVALIADAAHAIHPLAGQGINLGFSDIEALTGVIKHAVTRGEDFSSLQVLSRYQRARKPENLGMMLGMESFKRVFGSDELLLRFLRNQGLSLADRFGPLKHVLMQQAMGLRRD